MHNLMCPECGVEFRSRESNRRYCSMMCFRKNIKGRPKSKAGSGSINAQGYRRICVNGKHMLEHRYVMSLHLGRPLSRQEVVHHKDGDKLNNSISNLELLPNQGEHTQQHAKRFASDTHKECSRCKSVKPRIDFPCRGKGGRNKDPHGAYCKECQAEVARQRRLTKLGTCSACGRGPIYIQMKGKCTTCNSREWREANRERLNARMREYDKRRREKTE